MVWKQVISLSNLTIIMFIESVNFINNNVLNVYVDLPTKHDALRLLTQREQFFDVDSIHYSKYGRAHPLSDHIPATKR